ncbi:NCS2 family permease [Paenibacillus bovis]|uniref:Permease n=1 Tax=Paenibacillus bovis TaxID=1616788 RepID=A0A172ZK50_9BACL|nr:NCS2 family permease [Paenibacillus bovis]ANF98021.1 permease [Paenibacillus bovis]
MREKLQRMLGFMPARDVLRKEILAGVVAYFAVVYIVLVNATILSDAGIPLKAGMAATLLISIISCLVIAFLGKSPIIVVPGMGVNAFFTYTLVRSMGLSWQEALMVVTVSGLLFAIVAFTSLHRLISQAIPAMLQLGITVGIGLFLTFVGLQKSGIVIAHQTTFVTIGHFNDPQVIVSCVTLLVAVVLVIRNVPGGLLISILFGTIMAHLLGVGSAANIGDGSVISAYTPLFGAFTLEGMLRLPFWIAVFLLLLILVFENIGLIGAQTDMAKRPETFKGSLRALSISNILAGLIGSSPTVAAAESTAGIAAGGRTGITPLITAVLFGATFFFIPWLGYIPDSALAPVLIVIGAMMTQAIQEIKFSNFADSFPAFLIIVMIPFTYSIVDGMAFGFIAYPVVKLAQGKGREVPKILYGIAILFLANFVVNALL